MLNDSDFSLQHIVGVDVFLERFQTRIHVGKLENQKGQFHFTYDLNYLKAKNIFPLGPEFPLTRQEFFSKDLFPSFADRLPDPDNPAYPDYCASAGVAPEITDPIILLSTIGKKGPSSFIFEPIYKDTFIYEDCEKLREQLGLSLQDFAHLFDVSLSILHKMKVGESNGKEVLKRLEHYVRSPELLDIQIKRNMHLLHEKKQREVMFCLLQQSLSLFLDKHSCRFTFKTAAALLDRIVDYYQYISVRDDDKINREMKTINTEIKPILKIAEYFKLMGYLPQHITFCSKDESFLGYDGIFHWPNQDVRIEITRALDKVTGGQNEHLKKEESKIRAIIPYHRDYVGDGITHPSQLSKSGPFLSGKSEPINDTIRRLTKAFEHKNKKAKYQGYWLIITLPTPFAEDNFHEICSLFWQKMDKKTCIFSRVFVISEDFINCPTSIVISTDTGRTIKDLRQAIWDSAGFDMKAMEELFFVKTME